MHSPRTSQPSPPAAQHRLFKRLPLEPPFRTCSTSLRAPQQHSPRTSQPSPQAPSTGLSQLSSTKRMSCARVSMPRACKRAAGSSAERLGKLSACHANGVRPRVNAQRLRYQRQRVLCDSRKALTYHDFYTGILAFLQYVLSTHLQGTQVQLLRVAGVGLQDDLQRIK